MAVAALDRSRLPRTSTLSRLSPGPLFVVSHVAIGLLADVNAAAATAYVTATLLVVCVVITQTKRLANIAWAAGYIAMSDVLWRMTEARFFYEGAKYVVAGIFGVALVRLLRIRRRAGLPLAYMAMFMPAVALSFLTLGLVGSRELVSSNLSGPIALVVAVIFFSQVHMSLDALQSVFWAMLAPIVSIASIAAWSTITGSGSIEFRDASNFTASGGFGPNQVSALLGLGVLLCLLLGLAEPSRHRQVFEVVLGTALLTQALLTFSRGGIVNLLVSVIAVALVLSRHLGRSARLLALLGVVAIALVWFLVPRIDEFTGGAFADRYSSTDPTNRSELAALDIATFLENPLTGVGIGVSSYVRGESGGERIAAHTEYTRLLAEQGVFGIAAFILLLAMAGRAISRATPGLSRAIVVALTVWCFVEMMHAAMRIASISFVFGLAIAVASIERRSHDKNATLSTVESRPSPGSTMQ